MTSIEEVNATGILQAYITGGNHVVVVPTFFSISVWMNQGMSSIWSKTLSEIVNEIDRKRNLAMNINRIFDMLSWKNDTKTQLKGIEEASKIQYLSMFIQPCESKDLWENCAKILDSKTDEELQPYLVELFQWLQDMNWPGADIIYTRLKKFSWRDIQMAYSLCLQMAQEYNDTPWIDVLNEFCQEK